MYASKDASVVDCLHTVPKQIRSLKNTASATNPPNQNNIVNPSSVSRLHCAALDDVRCAYLRWMKTRARSARTVHEGAKMRKFTSEGEDWRQCEDHHDDTAD